LMGGHGPAVEAATQLATKARVLADELATN
jgi:hypothetical protein